MQVNREAYQIVGASLLTFFVLLTVDIYKVVNIPFSGAVHWLPELLAIFLLSNYLAKHFDSKTRWSIFTCALAFPLLVYRSTFGALTASIFGTAMLIGFLSVDIRKYTQGRILENDIQGKGSDVLC